jgi:hypothetical protein
MTLAERLSEFVRACFTGIWIKSFEPDDAVAEIARLCRQNHWNLATWDIDRGLSIAGQSETNVAVNAADPLAAIRALNALASAEGTAILVLRNFHRFLSSVEIVQALETQLAAGKQNRTFVVVLAPVVQIPVELEKQFLVLDHDLPGRDQLEAIARSIATEPGELSQDRAALDRVIEAATGLTRHEAENAYSLSLVRNGCLVPEVLWDLKMQALKKGNLLEMYRGFSILDQYPREPEPAELTLVVVCPHCIRAVPYAGLVSDGLLALAECLSCDALFDVAPGAIFAAARV